MIQTIPQYRRTGCFQPATMTPRKLLSRQKKLKDTYLPSHISIQENSIDVLQSSRQLKHLQVGSQYTKGAKAGLRCRRLRKPKPDPNLTRSLPRTHSPS